MLIITGANGGLGRAVVDGLVARVPANRVVACTREPEKVAELAGRGVAVRAGDFADPAGLASAFAGATQVLVVSVNKLGPEALQLHRAAIGAARVAGARRVLYTSHMGARADSPFAPAADHAETETFLAEGGGPFTSLRHGFYAESLMHLIGRDLEAGAISAPEDGPVSWTARADLAEADAAALADEGCLDGISPPLTAAAAITLDDVAAIASEVTGREIRRVTVTDDQWRDAAVARGVPAMAAELLLGVFRAARRGDFAATDPALARLIGRAPTTLRSFLEGRLSAPRATGHP